MNVDVVVFGRTDVTEERADARNLVNRTAATLRNIAVPQTGENIVITLSGGPVWDRGIPLPPCPFTSSFPLFTFPFLSLALPIFFFCPSLPFLPE